MGLNWERAGLDGRLFPREGDHSLRQPLPCGSFASCCSKKSWKTAFSWNPAGVDISWEQFIAERGPGRSGDRSWGSGGCCILGVGDTDTAPLGTLWECRAVNPSPPGQGAGGLGSGMPAPAFQAGWSSWSRAGKLQLSACRDLSSSLDPFGPQR